MADGTQSPLAEAYQAVFDGEKAMLVKMKGLLDTFNADVLAARGDQPTNAPSTAAIQFVQRLQSSVGSLVSFDLPNTLAQYGLKPDGTPVDTPATA